MTWFGRTLFGGPITGRIVAASGAIAGTATPSADARRTAYPRAPYTIDACTATVAGACTKTVFRSGVAVLASAASSVGERAQFFGAGTRAATAQPVGRQKVDYLDGGASAGLSASAGKVLKTYRMRPAGRLLATATVVGDADLYALAESIPLLCSALPFGTTYQVSRGEVQATVSLAADAARIRQVAAVSLAQVTVSAAPHVEFLGAGRSAGHLSLFAEPARYASNFYNTAPATGAWAVDASGRADALAAAVLGDNAYVHSVCLVVGRSEAAARIERIRLVRGASVPWSAGAGYGVIVIKAEAAGVLVSEAGGLGTCQFITGGVSTVLAEGAGVAAGRAAFVARASASGTATVAVSHAQLAVRSCAAAVATPDASPTRVAFGDSGLAGKATITGRARGEFLGRSPVAANAKGLGYPIFWPKQLVSGAADCVSAADGYMQVNNAVPAPIDRTVVVDRNDRVVTVSVQERLVTVGRSHRAMAA